MKPNELILSEDARRKALASATIVNNIVDSLGIAYAKFNSNRYILKEDMAAFLAISTAQINGVLASSGAELKKFGYYVLRGPDRERFTADATSVPSISSRVLRDSPQIIIFSLRAFLALAMMIPEGKSAEVRERVIAALMTGEKKLKEKARSSIAAAKHEVATKPAAGAEGPSRAISIRQPYIEQILRGDKTEEYRSMPTNIRERVYLYASEKPADDQEAWDDVGLEPGDLPVGLIVGTVEIVDCTDRDDIDSFAYVLKDPRRLDVFLKAKNQPQPKFWIPQFD